MDKSPCSVLRDNKKYVDLRSQGGDRFVGETEHHKVPSYSNAKAEDSVSTELILSSSPAPAE